MAYADSFVSCMAEQAGVTIDASAVTDESSFGSAVEQLKSWFDSLGPEAKGPLDEASKEPEKVAALLSEAGVATGLDSLLATFDALSGWPLSTLLEWCDYCAKQAAQAGESEGTETEGEQPSA